MTIWVVVGFGVLFSAIFIGAVRVMLTTDPEPHRRRRRS